MKIQHNMIDCIVTTGGAIEEDIMKCFAPHYMGSWELKGIFFALFFFIFQTIFCITYARKQFVQP